MRKESRRGATRRNVSQKDVNCPKETQGGAKAIWEGRTWTVGPPSALHCVAHFFALGSTCKSDLIRLRLNVNNGNRQGKINAK